MVHALEQLAARVGTPSIADIGTMPKRYPLTTVLEHLDSTEASTAVALLAKGLAAAIERGGLEREDAEHLLFNLDVLLYVSRCDDPLLRTCIEHGMELEDIEELVGTSEALAQGCSAVRSKADQILGRDVRERRELDVANPEA